MGCCPSWILQTSGCLSVPSLLGLRGSGQHRDSFRVAYVPLSFMEVSPVEQWPSSLSQIIFLFPRLWTQHLVTCSFFWAQHSGNAVGEGTKLLGVLWTMQSSLLFCLFSSSWWSCLLRAGLPYSCHSREQYLGVLLPLVFSVYPVSSDILYLRQTHSFSMEYFYGISVRCFPQRYIRAWNLS